MSADPSRQQYRLSSNSEIYRYKEKVQYGTIHMYLVSHALQYFLISCYLTMYSRVWSRISVSFRLVLSSVWKTRMTAIYDIKSLTIKCCPFFFSNNACFPVFEKERMCCYWSCKEISSIYFSSWCTEMYCLFLTLLRPKCFFRLHLGALWYSDCCYGTRIIYTD